MENRVRQLVNQAPPRLQAPRWDLVHRPYKRPTSPDDLDQLVSHIDPGR